MVTINLPNNWSPRAKQLNLWSYLENGGKRAIYAWHRRYGKDDVGLHWTAVSTAERVGTYWYLLPEAAQAKKAIWEAVNPHTGKRRIDEAFPVEWRSAVRNDEMFMRFKNGSTWQVVGSDNYNSLVGSPPIGVVFSEWALANPSAWGYLMPILNENGGWAMFNSTPRGRNHMYRMLKSAETKSNWFSEVLDVHDTGALTEAELADALRDYQDAYGIDIGQNLYDQEYLCSFDAAILGAYFGRELRDAEKAGRIGNWPHDPSLPVHTGWDLGVDDPMAIWWFQVAGRDVRILDFHEESYTDFAKCKRLDDEKCEADGWVRGDDLVPHDAKVFEMTAGRTRIEVMKDVGFRPRLIPRHKPIDGINAVRKMMARTFWHKPRVEEAVEGVRQYHAEWDDEKKTFRPTPYHDWTSHRCDALRAIAMGYQEVNNTPTPETGRRLAVGYANTATFDDLWKDQPKKGARI